SPGPEVSVPDPWPREQSRPTSNPWANPLFPGADQDLLGLDFSPLAALESLTTTDAVARATLATGGCVVSTQVERLPRVQQVQTIANVTFVLEDSSGRETGYRLQRVGAP